MSDVSIHADPDPHSQEMSTRRGVVQPPMRNGEWFDDTINSDVNPMRPAVEEPDSDDNGPGMVDVLSEDLDLGPDR